MKLIHTSDWHLGRMLYGKKRYAEFEAFLSWLAETIQERQIDALLVAGDIFDTNTPSNRAQTLYYRFLWQMAQSSCRHIVIIAGNHDSPSFLNAPQELLKALDVHVVGRRTEAPQDEVLVLNNAQGEPELIVCAVPYLRDRDIRTAEAGESIADKEQKLRDGIHEHYATVAALAEQQRKALGVDIPIVAMGHLFTAGGQTLDGDGVRELYIGSLAHVTARVFPDCCNYVALGHLHVPQQVGGQENIRYSGSPIPMGFGEAKQQKSACQVTFSGTSASVELIDVPVFQQLARIQGHWQEILAQLAELAACNMSIWLEIIYEGQEVIGDLRERLESATAGTQLEILKVKNKSLVNHVLGRTDDSETLENLNEIEVFQRLLQIKDIPEEEHSSLKATYREVLTLIHEHDVKAE
jgi:exonuclease SbcD